MRIFVIVLLSLVPVSNGSNPYKLEGGATPPISSAATPPPNVAGVCTSTYDARLNGCRVTGAMTLAKQLLAVEGSKWSQYQAVSAAGMRTHEELQNIAAGACPCVEKYQEPSPDPSGGFLGAEANVQAIHRSLGLGGTRMLTSVVEIVNNSSRTVQIRTLGGGNHKYAAHRRFEAADIAVVHTAAVKEDVAKATGSYWDDNGPTSRKVPIDPNAAQRLCETAQWLLARTNVQLVLVHGITKSVAPCSIDARVVRADDHYQHYHVQVSSASTGTERPLLPAGLMR